MHLIIFGRGKMARLIGQKCLGHADVASHETTQTLPFPDGRKPDTVVIHVGSGRYLPQLIAECGRLGYPLIQASSGQKLPESVPVPVIDAPNLALPIVALFEVLPLLGASLQALGGTTKVMESHQASKTSAPITAQKIAGYFGNPPESVISVRDVEVQQRTLGVPVGYLDGHAYHFVRTEVHGITIEVSFKVHGRDAYFDGAVAVAKKIVELGPTLTTGVHSVNDLLAS